MNKSMFMKIDQMMETISDSFKGMQGQIRVLEDANQRLERKLEELEVTNASLRKTVNALKGGGGKHVREASEGSVDSVHDSLGAEDTINEEILDLKRNGIVKGALRKVSSPVGHGRHESGSSKLSLDSMTPIEEISMPVIAPVKRKRWFETEAAAGIDVNALSKTEFARQEAIYELIDSEEDYVKDLHTMINVHMVQMKGSTFVADRDVQTLFSNVDQILQVNLKFLEALTARRKASPILEKIGDVFLSMSEYFKTYTVYCSNHSTAGSLLKKLLTANAEFKNLHDHITHQIPEVKHLTLESYLIKPIQRICKYPLLLREILRQTPEDHLDFKDTTDALEKIEAVITIVNERTQLLDQSQKLLLLQSRIESEEPLELLQPSRKFLHEGTLEVQRKGGKRKELYFLLCSDLLLICKPIGFSKARYQLYKRVLPGMFLVNNTGEGVKESVFELILVGQEKWLVFCPNEEEKKKWVKFLEQANMDIMKSTNVVKKSLSIAVDIAEIDKEKKPTSLHSSSVSFDELDEKPARTSKAMKLLGFEDSDTSGNNAKIRASTIKEKRIESRLGIPFESSSSTRTKDSSSSTNGFPHPETLPNLISELYYTGQEYTSKTEYELSFEARVYVVVTNKFSEEFWKIETKSSIGYVPASHLIRAPLPRSEEEKIIDECYTIGVHGIIKGGGLAKKVSREGYIAAGRTWRLATLSDGTSYYYCPETYETCYSLPKDSQQYFSWFEEPVAMRPEWKLIVNNELRYYLNLLTGTTAWKLPEDVEENDEHGGEVEDHEFS